MSARELLGRMRRENDAMKGIILAGGSGTRLYPMTLAISKQLLPVYDKPMIYYPLATLMLAGIREILIITTPQDRPLFQAPARRRQPVGHRARTMPCSPSPTGLAQAFIIGADFVAGGPLVPGARRQHLLRPRLAARCCGARPAHDGATVFAYQVADPERYGVVEFDAAGARSSHRGEAGEAEVELGRDRALFLRRAGRRDRRRPQAFARAASSRSPTSTRPISTRASCTVERLGRGYAWLDTGTPDSPARGRRVRRARSSSGRA